MYTRIMFKFVQRKGAIRVFRSVFLVLSSHYSVKGASKNEHVALNCVAKQIQEINQRGAANQGVSICCNDNRRAKNIGRGSSSNHATIL
jgi:hypothetical protein